MVMPQSLPNEALGDAKGVNQARYHVEMTPESCSAVHPNMVPNAPNMLQNMAKIHISHAEAPKLAVRGPPTDSTAFAFEYLHLHCGEYSARSCKRMVEKGMVVGFKSCAAAPDSLNSRHPEVHEKMQRCWRASV